MPQVRDSLIIDPYDVNTVRIENKGDHTIYHYAQEVSSILNNNERLKIDGNGNKGKGEIRPAASIPMATWILWESMGIVQDEIELRKAIERNTEFKTTERRLI